MLRIIIIIGALLLTGCAHQIQINPHMEKFQVAENKIDKVVGYHISKENLSKKVTTPGGGGDKVSYTPYKDTETVIYNVLSNKFKDVYLVADLSDQNFIKENSISLVFIPEISTNSSSSSPFTWPPTKFSIVLNMQAINDGGDVIWEQKLSAEGLAEYDEFKSDFSLSARRATEKVFLQLVEELDKIQLN